MNTVGHGAQVAVEHMAVLALSFAGCDVQGSCPCGHGMAGTCNTLGTHILSVWLMAACSSLLGKGSLALAALQSHGRHREPWHGAGPGWSLAGSAKHPGRSQWSAGTKGALTGDSEAAGRESRKRHQGAGQRIRGCHILSYTPLP